MRNLSFKRQSIIIISLMSGLLLATIIAVSIININNLRLEDKILLSRLPLSSVSQKLIFQINHGISKLNEYLLVNDEVLLNAYRSTDKEAKKGIKYILKDENISSDQKQQVQLIQNKYTEITRQAERVIRLHQTPDANYPGLTLANSVMNPAYLAYLAVLEEIRQEVQFSDIAFKQKALMLEQVAEIKYLFSQLAGSLRIYLINRSNSQFMDMQNYKSIVNEYNQKVETIVDELDLFTSEDLSYLWQIYSSNMEQLLKIYSSGEWRQDTWLMKNSVIPGLESLQLQLNQLEHLNKNQMNTEITTLFRYFNNTMLFSLVVVFLLLLLGIISVRLIYSIIRPVRDLGQFIRCFSFINPSPVPSNLVHNRNEVGEFAAIVKNMIERLLETYETDKQIRLQMEHQWQALIQHELVILFKPDGTISYLNSLLTDLIGYTETDIQGLSIFSVVRVERNNTTLFDDPDDNSDNLMRDAVEAGKGWSGNIIVNSKNDTLIHISLSIMPYQDLFGNTIEYIAIGSDISLLMTAQMEIEKNNRLLEQRVAERTQELLRTNEELDQSYKQLLHSEKMASVGQLAAGVAHEINNPIGFINSNMGTLSQYLGDVFALLESYEKHLLVEGNNNTFITEEKTKYDYDYIREDIEALIKESHEGLERVKIIVRDLKNFSHADSGEWHEEDINEIIESTLNVAHNNIKYVAKVDKNYGELPLLRCNKSQLGQVFLNLLINASQAIEDFGTITISSKATANNVIVSIADTGKGMPQDILDKIFDPFYTTKPIGKGTGLGLSLSYGIIEKHHGSIEVLSELGKGTEFIVKVPITETEHEAVSGRR